MKTLFFIPIISLVVIVSSCTKEAGEGGNSSIIGKVYVKDYNSSFSTINAEYYGADEDVYIIYGNDVSYGNKTKSSFDGSYEFKFLREGAYKIYTYSKDSTLKSQSGTIPVIQDVEITKTKQELIIPDLIIAK